MMTFDSLSTLSEMSQQENSTINQDNKQHCNNINPLGNMISDLMINIINNKKPTKSSSIKGCQKWTNKNKLIFERLLGIFGTDFSLMAEYFKLHTNQPFSEKILKNKFKREYQGVKIQQINKIDNIDQEIQNNLSK